MTDVVTADASAGPHDLTRRTVNATLWTAGSRVSQQVVQLAISVVLARLLLPREFGLVAMITVFTGFARVLVDAGFGAALVQRAQLERRHISTAFWLNLAVGIVLSGISAGLAPLVARFYHQPALTLLTAVMGLNFVLVSLSIVQVSLLERQMNFRRIAFIENLSLVVAGVVATVCALTGFGVWSLIVFTLAGSAIQTVALWLSTDWHPGRMSREAFKELWNFGKHLAGSNAINYWMRNADNLLIGRFVGPTPLALYSRAYTLMLFPLTQVSSIIGRTLFPALARVHQDVARVRSAYLRSLSLVSFMTFPIAVGLFVAAKPLIEVLLGARWLGVVPLLQILCLPALVQSIGTMVGAIYLSQGRTDWILRWQMIAGVVTIGAFLIGVHWGAKGVAIAYAARQLPITLVSYSIAGRLVDMTLMMVMRKLAGPLAAAFVAGAAAWLAGHGLGGAHPSVQLLTEAIAMVAAYGGIAHVAKLEAYGELRALLRPVVRRARASRHFSAASETYSAT
jgi:PST family polysaccharide transporter